MKKVLLIGDSIRIGYDRYIRMAFEGKAEVFYPSENCRFTTYIIRALHDWKNNLGCGDDVDVVHWNAGLWDDLRMTDGEPLVEINEYARNIERICKLLKSYFPNAKMIFATSTPVQEELFGELKRLNRDTESYNARACEIVKKYGMEVNDLYSLMTAQPLSYHSDLTHYYTKDGTRVMTEQVAQVIGNALDEQPKKLDYDALFADKSDVVGM